MKTTTIWTCPAVVGTPLADLPAVVQQGLNGAPVRTWFWRFARKDDPQPLNYLWGKTDDQALGDLQNANDPQVGLPTGMGDVELAVDPYFPRDANNVAPSVAGLTVHGNGRNRVYFDGHAKFFLDARLGR